MAQVNENNRIKQAQREVNDVVDTMRTNLEKVLERDAKLSDLDQRADHLEQSSVTFATSSKKLKKKMWWEDFKMKLIMLAVLMTVIIIIVVVIVCETGGSSSSNQVTTIMPEIEKKIN